ncbi:MAG: cation:dicarboxylase symporter family transporter [Butyrivibrio sp.]|nr:cation:dicarboxylase symporter family transporter [Butyrivibrio sp.]
MATLNRVLDLYREKLGEQEVIQYVVRKRFMRIDCTLSIAGEMISPLDAENYTSNRERVERTLNHLLINKTDQVSYIYSARHNIVSVASLPKTERSILKSPMIWAVVLGLILGIICNHLPEDVKTIILDDIMTPLFNVCIGIITRIMVPVIFSSLLTSIAALRSVDDLTNLGFKIIRRFVIVTVSIIVVGIAVTLIFYYNFGVSSVDFSPENLFSLILNIIPTNIVSPFADGNTPQLVVLALFFGAALLVAGDKAHGLKDILGQINFWIMSAMGIAMTVCPVIPFVSIFSVVAKGNGRDLLNGWEFVVASYAICTICGIIKLILVCTRCNVKISVVWKKLWPMVSNAFVSGNNTTILKQEYDISEKDLGITPVFSSFWIPMSQAMFNPRQTVSLLVPPILILKYMGIPISMPFLVIYFLLVLELSIANPGTAGGWTILFAALSLPADYVGAFMLYRMFTQNYNAAFGALEMGLEQIAMAHKHDEIDLEKLREEKAG